MDDILAGSGGLLNDKKKRRWPKIGIAPLY
jgi:hypothetical protein